MDDFPEDKGAQKRRAINKAKAKKEARLQVSSSLLEDHPNLTEKQAVFVEGMASGMNKTDSARAAGFAHPVAASSTLINLPAISEAMAAERVKNARMAGVSRQDVIEGIKEAIGQAKLLAEPMAQIAGWREIAKICGHYAPEVKELRLTGSQEAKLKEMQSLTDDELLQLSGTVTVEGESTRVIEEAKPEDGAS